MSQRFEGSNLEEALNSAAAVLGVERYQIAHRVIVEKRGFFGGIKRVVIEADVDASATAPPPAYVPPPDTSAPPLARTARGPRAPRAAGGGGRERGPRGGRGRGDRGGRGGFESRGRNGNERGRAGQHRQAMDDLRPGDFERAFAADAPEQGPESEAATLVRSWCEQVASLARLSLVLRTEENEQQIAVRFYGADANRLVERDGELLDAMQVLANKALVGRKVEKEIEFDSGDFKRQRVDDIGSRARAMADRVRRDGREQLMPAMSPVERRIVHLALQDDADVTTESRGEGFFKRVAIIPRPDSAVTAGEP